MKSIVKNIFITIVALTLLFSITGFQVYKHTCASHNFSAVSVIETPECEKDHQVFKETDDCCKIEEAVEPSCCESEARDNASRSEVVTSQISCCTSTVENFKSAESLFPPAEKKNGLGEVDVEITKLNLEVDQYSNAKTTINTYDLPPPVYGKKLLQTIHQLKIDTPVC